MVAVSPGFSRTPRLFLLNIRRYLEVPSHLNDSRLVREFHKAFPQSRRPVEFSSISFSFYCHKTLLRVAIRNELSDAKTPAHTSRFVLAMKLMFQLWQHREVIGSNCFEANSSS